METIRVALPKKYDLVVGDTFQLFYRGVIEAPNPFVYDILVSCVKGKNFPRYFEFLPEEPGKYELTLSVFGADKSLLGQGKTILNVVAPVQPVKPLNILCIGDSLTGGGQWPKEAYRRLTSVNGEPKGLGFQNISFIGNCKKDDVGYEAFGGWTWESFLSATVGDFWVHCAHEKTLKDQHSIWQDEDGNLWQLETIDCGRLKFTRFGKQIADKPEGGYLIHVRNAVQKDPIKCGRSYYEKPSPFYDSESQCVDFKKYCERNGYDGIDAMFVLLGLNGLVGTDTSVTDFCKEVVTQGKRLVDLLHESYPKAKVRVMGVTMPSVHGGTGWSYGAIPPYCDRYGLVRYVMELNLAYDSWAREPEYCDFVEYVNVSGQFDSENAFPSIEKPVNVRSEKTEQMDVNGLHPLTEGYMMVADAAFRSMVNLCNC